MDNSSVTDEFELQCREIQSFSEALQESVSNTEDLSTLTFSSQSIAATLNAVQQYCSVTADNYNGSVDLFDVTKEYLSWLIDVELEDGSTTYSGRHSINRLILMDYVMLGRLSFNVDEPWGDGTYEFHSGQVDGQSLWYTITTSSSDQSCTVSLRHFRTTRNSYLPIMIRFERDATTGHIRNITDDDTRAFLDDAFILIDGKTFSLDVASAMCADKQAALNFINAASYHAAVFGECNQQTVSRLLDQYCGIGGPTVEHVKASVSYARGLSPVNIVSIFSDLIDLGHSSVNGNVISYDISKPIYITDIIQYILIGIGFVLAAVLSLLGSAFSLIATLLLGLASIFGSTVNESTSWSIDIDSIVNPGLSVEVPIIAAPVYDVSFVNGVREAYRNTYLAAGHLVELYGGGSIFDYRAGSVLNFWKLPDSSFAGQLLPSLLDFDSAFRSVHFQRGPDLNYNNAHSVITKIGAAPVFPCNKLASLGGDSDVHKAPFLRAWNSEYSQCICPISKALNCDDASISRMATGGLGLAICNSLAFDKPVNEDGIVVASGEPATYSDYCDWTVDGVAIPYALIPDSVELYMPSILGTSTWDTHRTWYIHFLNRATDESGWVEVSSSTVLHSAVRVKAAALFLVAAASGCFGYRTEQFNSDQFNSCYSSLWSAISAVDAHVVLHYNINSYGDPDHPEWFSSGKTPVVAQSASLTLKQASFKPANASRRAILIAGAVLLTAAAVAVTAGAVIKRKMQNAAALRLAKYEARYQQAQNDYYSDPSRANAKAFAKANRKLTRAWNKASASGLSMYNGFSTGSNSTASTSFKPIQEVISKGIQEFSCPTNTSPAVSFDYIADLINPHRI